MSTEVIYARVPLAVKEAADSYASQHGKSLTSAVVDLLERGLTAASNERSVAQLETNMARVTAEKAEAEADLHAARTQLAGLAELARRADRAVGTCPVCQKQITGYDLLVSGHCREGGHALSSLITPDRSTSTLDQREMLLLVGALGVVLGVAYLASR